ncbi:MAG: nucleotidyltransferase domain-containing protein [Firmicutes bacterium]|nr:nucleotidyltransferase domain-containing protein [Bacillota bacterium]
MINIEMWIEKFVKALKTQFGERVWFVGLQGSYGRGEARINSDIDMVVILDQVTVSDVESYSKMLDTLPERELICGFFAGKEELLNWAPADLFQFYYDTKPLEGSLELLLEQIDHEAVEQAIKIGAGNIYHGCVHNMIHEKNEEILRELYKAAVFVIQAVYYRQTGVYIKQQEKLMQVVPLEERCILQTWFALKEEKRQEQEESFQIRSERMFYWVQGLLRR